MREHPEAMQARAAWLNQPEEGAPVDIERIRERRTWELFATTRSEIIGSIVAALLFCSVVAWRFAGERDRLVQFGCIAVLVWAGISVYRFRDAIRRRASQPDAYARTGLEHYRAELSRRRDHLRSAWIWHGPLLLACAVAVATLAKRIVLRRVWDAVPLVLLLVGSAVIGIRRRRRKAAELQQEIDAISQSSMEK